MNLGEKIYNLRIENNMSQGDLAEALQVSRRSVSKWETNTSVPELDKLVKMSEVFNISLDELVRGAEAEEEKMEGQSPEVIIQKSGLAARKIVGLILLGIGFIIFLFISLLSFPLEALILSSPFLLCAVICLFIPRHTALYCFWVLYIMIHAYLRYATGIRFWWIFHPWVYRSGLEIHALIAWAMSLVLAVLIIVSIRVIYRERVGK